MPRLFVIVLLVVLAAAGCRSEPGALDRALAVNGGPEPPAPGPWPPVEMDLPARVGWWARSFLGAGEATYCFGPAEGGYVAEGRLVLDARHDCISLLYRCGELARASDAADAVAWALATRFAGAPADSVVGPDGRVDYDHPAHLDFSVDMIRSGLWGRDLTAELTGALPDSTGTPRYPAGSVVTVPAADLVPSELREGDIAWCVLDPGNRKARALRDEYGLMIGHVGIVILEEGEPWLVHAASSDLPGWYEGGQIVKVPLAEYLARVERYGAIMVTRFSKD